MPIRRAVLLSSSAPTPTDTPSCVVDVREWSGFLRSPFGGAWRVDEMRELTGPTLEAVHEALRWTATADFAFFVHCGRATRSFGGDLSQGFLGLGGNDSIFTHELNAGPRCRRQVVVVDSGRRPGFFRESQRASFEEGPLVRPNLRVPDPMKCRVLYDRRVQQADEGRVVVYSASSRQHAGENEKGGFFTRIFLQTAHGAVRGHPGPAWFSLHDAFEHTREKMQLVLKGQEPEADFGRRRAHFPLAVVAR